MNRTKLSFMVANEEISRDASVTGLRGPLEETLYQLNLAGFNHFELMIADPDRVEIAKIESLEKLYRVKPAFLCTGEMAGMAGLALNDIEPLRRKKAREVFEMACQKAYTLGVNLNIGRLRGGIWEDGLKKSLSRLGEVLREVDEFISASLPDLTVLIEPLRGDVCPLLNNCPETLDFIRAEKLKNFAILLDSDHFDSSSDSTFVRENIETIKHVHLADSHHIPLGRGELDFENFFKLLEEAGYPNGYSVEVFCGEDQYDTLRETVEFLKKYPLFEGELA